MKSITYIEDARRQFLMYQGLADKSLARLSNDQFFQQWGDEKTSVAVIVKHLGGNMRSRWTEFFTSDGEEPDRQRDTEFVVESTDTREQLMTKWQAGYRLLFEALTEAESVPLEQVIHIRTEPHTIVQAINRQLTHYAYHIGQIVWLSRHMVGSEWSSLSVPRDGSDEFNAAKGLGQEPEK